MECSEQLAEINIYFLVPPSAHLDRQWEWRQVPAIKKAAFIVGGANTAQPHFVAHFGLMTDDLKPFPGCKKHPVALMHQSQKFWTEAERFVANGQLASFLKVLKHEAHLFFFFFFC